MRRTGGAYAQRPMTVAQHAAPVDAEPSPEASDRTHPSIHGLAAAAACFLLPLAVSPGLGSPFWSPKAALLLVLLAGPGLSSFVVALRSTALRNIGLSCCVFLAAGVIGSIGASSPTVALFGNYRWGNGLIF